MICGAHGNFCAVKGLTVSLAPGCARALQLLSEGLSGFDIVLMDTMMPDMGDECGFIVDGVRG